MAKKYYEENGYLIIEKVISQEKINNLLYELNLFKKRNQLYYSQSEHNWVKANDRIDKFNLLESSFENFTI